MMVPSMYGPMVVAHKPVPAVLMVMEYLTKVSISIQKVMQVKSLTIVMI